MKKIVFSLAIVSMMVMGCQSKAGTGALAGGALGAGAGALIDGGTGAAIGAGVGIVSGALIGHALDEQDRKIMKRTSPRTVERMDRGEPLTISDIIRLSEGGVSDETIIDYIKQTRTRYTLSQAQVNRLREGGVSRRVINYMVDTGR
ncbi:MAG TPA: glycine zipper domain-containing protein [Chlamydiales bacterium]|nr:glycine zipper domain-containing protein [Chlamydiales bacterium]